MNKMKQMMKDGYDLALFLIGDKTTYYVYLSHPEFGNYFAYGFGKTLDSATDMAFDKTEEKRRLKNEIQVS